MPDLGQAVTDFNREGKAVQCLASRKNKRLRGWSETRNSTSAGPRQNIRGTLKGRGNANLLGNEKRNEIHERSTLLKSNYRGEKLWGGGK